MDLRTLSAVLMLAASGCGGSSSKDPSSVLPANAALPGITYEAHIAAGGVPPTGSPLSNSRGHDASVVNAGESLFGAMNCDGCHAAGGTGWIAPSLADGRWRYGGADQEIFSSIYYGRPKGMPAFGGVLDAAGVWSLVAYLKSLPVPAAAPTQSWNSGQ